MLFVGTSRGLEARVVPAAGYALELLEVSGLKRMGAASFVRGLARLPGAFARSIQILRRWRPDVVIGVGGYASGPMVLAAALTGRCTAIEEQNSVPGFTNRTLGRFVKAVFVGFPEAGAAFPTAKVAHTGNPVRRAFVAAAARATTGDAAAGPGRLLVVGGSQGARAVNDLVLGAAALWAQQGRVPAIVHQTGKGDAERVAAAYAQLGLAAQVKVAPFIEDMAQTYAAADLVVGRAGLTLAELAVAARPAILVPLPTAADDHQTKNAEAFAAAGAALRVSQATTTPEALAAEVTGLLQDWAARRHGRGDGGLAGPRRRARLSIA